MKAPAEPEEIQRARALILDYELRNLVMAADHVRQQREKTPDDPVWKILDDQVAKVLG